MHPRSSSPGYVLIVTNAPLSRLNDAGVSDAENGSPRGEASRTARAMRTATSPSASVYIVSAMGSGRIKIVRAPGARMATSSSFVSLSLYATAGYDGCACDEARATPRARGHDEGPGHLRAGDHRHPGGVRDARPRRRKPDRRRGRQGDRDRNGARHRDEGRGGGWKVLH